MQYIILQAQAGAQQGGSIASSLIFFAVLFGIMYFLMIRPQQNARKKLRRCWIACR